MAFLLIPVNCIAYTEIQNAGFESGYLNPWINGTQGGTLPVIISSNQYHSGQYSVYSQTGSYTYPYIKYDNVNCAGIVNISFWYYASSTNLQLKCWFSDNGYSNEYGAPGNNQVTAVNTWTKVTMTSSIPPSGNYTFVIRWSGWPDGVYNAYIDDVQINNVPVYTEPVNYNEYEISIVDSMTGGLVTSADSCFYNMNKSIWTNYTAITGQHLANLTANDTYQWYVVKTGYTTYTETFTANYANGYTVVKSCSLINMGEPLDPALTYVTFRVTSNSRLTGALVALDDGQSKLTDGEGVAFFMVPKYEDYNYYVKYTGCYPLYGTFNLSSSTYIDVSLTPMAVASPTPTPGSGQLPDYDLGSIEDLTALYKDLVNASIDKSLNRTYEAFNDTAGWYFLQLNNSASTWHQLFIDQYETPTGYGYVYYDLLDLIFSFIPAQVKAQIAYYFLWIFFLILLGK